MWGTVALDAYTQLPYIVWNTTYALGFAEINEKISLVALFQPQNQEISLFSLFVIKLSDNYLIKLFQPQNQEISFFLFDKTLEIS